MAPTTFDRTTIRHNLTEFKLRWLAHIEQWKAENRPATESSHDQQFWGDLLDCFGVNARDLYLYQRSAKRASTGRTGKIDMFMPGKVIGEAKSLGVSLDDAYAQALDYLLGGTIANSHMPAYVICSNFETLRVTRLNRTYVGDSADWDITFPLEEIDEHVDQLAFLADYETTAYREEEKASLEASRLMVELFRAMNGDDVDEAVGDDAPTTPEEEDERVMRTSIYLTRILFLLFGDDAGLWDTPHLFADFVRNETTPESLGPQLNELFSVLNTAPEKRPKRLPATLAKFPYVNGALFAEPLASEYFDYQMRKALLAACDFDWSTIDVSVFGSLFQLVKSKEARRSDGEHYTSKANIMKTIGPLFLDELRAEADKLVSSPSTSVAALERFRDSLAELVFCDPACGSGNFLLLAYRELRRIETDIIVAIRQRRGETGMSLNIEWEQKLSIGQFYGFELNWWPAKIAETAMFLVDHQANKELANAVGRPPERLPIKITAHIYHGNALQLDWADILPVSATKTYVFGNPPFLGHATRTAEQAQELRDLWGTKDISRLDYVTGWHAKCLDFFESREGRFAFVTTNSITQGDQVPRLFGPIFKAGWRIRFAHRTFAWDSEAPGKAAVHCVIVGFDKESQPRPGLWDYPDVKGKPVSVEVGQGINGYLVDGPNVLVEKSKAPISLVVTPAVFGNMARDGGNLLVEVDEYNEVMSDPIAAKYVRPFRGSRELMNGLDRWCLWLVDVAPSDIAQSPVLKKRLEAVKAFRADSKAASTRKMAETPHLFGQRSQPSTDYLCLPKVVSERRSYFTVQRYPSNVIASDLVFHAQDPDGLQFSLASSSMFITWQKTIGGRLESRIRFANTLTWNTFPVPELDKKTRQRIINAGKKVLDARALHPERSLAEHYNPLAMSPELVKAHDALDREVDKAFGAPRKLTTERQRQELLFVSYAELTKKKGDEG
ncbi:MULTISPECIES: DNA methyltransferase [Corynebacterium]|uniref:DNA methyltransferase n=1 Tax=Corynebacterium TaxID=1716 RepID=UPI00223C4AD2|nr:DNA methyltransferase [Corynebacterium kefirresidentii]MCT2188412.1 N-6 DNA methylase [Corynebacterium kefirresidentii]MDK8586243.1 N-6 DNA methylase [Corynebacterium kefirresidentii]